MRFVAIDVETANPDVASICQIGVAGFVDGALANEWSTLVDPEDYFDEINVSLHGIELSPLLPHLDGFAGVRLNANKPDFTRSV